MSSLNIRNKKIAFIVPYPFDTAPGQRFRYEQYLDLLKVKEFEIKIYSFLTPSVYGNFYERGSILSNMFYVLLGFLNRIVTIPFLFSSHYVFIFREAGPIGPPVIEWIIAKLLRKKIIYDFDDAIWLTDKTGESFIERKLRWRSKTNSICKWSYKNSCGNAYLAKYAQQFNLNTFINPTTIDAEFVHNPTLHNKAELKKENNLSGIVIGWTGSRTTLKYLEELYPVLKQLEDSHPEIIFLVIADQPPRMELKNLLFKKWSKENEIADLMLADIGIMPLPDNDWSKGKCGFKALQYMALEIPALVSPVGVNTDIIENGVTGFHCTTEEEWISCIEILIQNNNARIEMGAKGRIKVIERYSVKSNTANFLEFFT